MTKGKKKAKSKRSVLIVEDEEITSMFEKIILEQEGYEVDLAINGLEGLEKIKQKEYDVILCNIEMPRMQGDELYQKVNKLNQGLAEKIIFVSGTIDAFIKSTGNMFLVKPFTLQQLVQTVKNFLQST
ncbi:MAG TPA: response regulator [Thermodesulfobacteriota bacterium]|nr:response regulator [Thermodesulfobacteriota bacterium]